MLNFYIICRQSWKELQKSSLKKTCTAAKE